MRGPILATILLSLSTLAGCTRTCEVRFINQSDSVTDFRIDEFNHELDTFVLDLAPGANPVTVIHQSMGNRLTIQSGTALGQSLTVIDAECAAHITDGDTVVVTKQPDGELVCEVIPGIPLTEPRR